MRYGARRSGSLCHLATQPTKTTETPRTSRIMCWRCLRIVSVAWAMGRPLALNLPYAGPRSNFPSGTDAEASEAQCDRQDNQAQHQQASRRYRGLRRVHVLLQEVMDSGLHSPAGADPQHVGGAAQSPRQEAARLAGELQQHADVRV